MKDEFITRVGVWGQRHYSYLKKHFPTAINVMRMKGTLEQYLKDIDKDAKDMFDKLVKQLADSEGPSITGIPASGPISPRPSTAVPSVITATRLFLLVSSKDFS